MNDNKDRKLQKFEYLEAMQLSIDNSIDSQIISAFNKNPDLLDVILKYIFYGNDLPANQYTYGLADFSEPATAYNWIVNSATGKSNDDYSEYFVTSCPPLNEKQKNRAKQFISHIKKIQTAGYIYIMKLFLLELTIINDLNKESTVSFNDIVEYYDSLPHEKDYSDKITTRIRQKLRDIEKEYDDPIIAKVKSDFRNNEITFETADELISKHISKEADYQPFNFKDFIRKDLAYIHLMKHNSVEDQSDEKFRGVYPKTFQPYYAFIADFLRLQDNIFTKLDSWIYASQNNLSNRWKSLKPVYDAAIKVARLVLAEAENSTYITNSILIDHVANLQFLANLKSNPYASIIKHINPDYFLMPNELKTRSHYEYCESQFYAKYLKKLCIFNIKPELISFIPEYYKQSGIKNEYFNHLNYQAFLYDYMDSIYTNSGTMISELFRLFDDSSIKGVALFDVITFLYNHIVEYDNFEEYKSGNKMLDDYTLHLDNKEKLVIINVLNHSSHTGLLNTL